MLPLAVYHARHLLAKLYGVFAYKHVRTNLYGLDVLGIAVERDARHGVERSLFSHIARVGDDAESVGCEVAEVQIVERSHDMQLLEEQRILVYDALNGVGSKLAQRSHNRNIACVRHHAHEKRTQLVVVTDDSLAVEREDDVLFLCEAQFVHHSRTLEALVVEAQCVHKNIAHHVYLRRLGALACSSAVAANASRKEQIGKAVDDEAVDLLRHRDVERACASYKMSQQNALLLCDDSRSHCRSEVINNDNDICRMLLKIALEGRHNLTRKLIEVNAVDTKAYVGATDLKVVEERRLECGVVLTTCVNQTATYLLAFSLSLVNGTNDWGNLNEVGTCANKYTNVHILLLFFF